MDPAFVQRIKDQMAYEFARTEPPDAFPKLPDLPLGRYTDRRFHELERTRLWRRSWLFAAHETELPEPGSYRTLDLAGMPVVVVRGIDGAIRAFFNACRHRGAPVVRDECGTCHLMVCTYHSWSYDHTGRLVRVPDERDFVGLQPDERALVPLRCERWGGLVFVNADPEATPLADHLGALHDELMEVMGADLRVIQRHTTVHQCNWKIMAEGFLEVYHAKTIHPQTVAPVLDPRGAAISLLPNGHTRMITPLRQEIIERGRETHRGLPEIPGVSELFFMSNPAYGVFPNLITPLDHRGFPLLLFWPEAVDRTRLERVWLGPADGVDHPTWSTRIAGFEVVMEEDTKNLEPVQAAVEAAAHAGVPLNYQERRIWHVHTTIDAVMGRDDVPEDLAVPDLLHDWVDAPV
jgi:nitrite reductase/ring-hydroxylating ferredoxin subunit